MSSDVAISVRGLSKSYTIRHNQTAPTTLAEAAVHRLKHPFDRPEREEFCALDGVSFDVSPGEVLGVIGRNGAGKSTLLKVLSRITAPTRGEVHIYGRVGSLLEVGTGFHPELTGRENIYLNGSILGMRRREIAGRFDEIVSFAGVEQFLDTPVKRYSSGMYVRLAFAVAAHLDTDILLLDEVLAVGDQEFQRRSLGKVRDGALSGKTVILVSHNMPAIQAFSTRALLLHSGSATVYENPQAAIEAHGDTVDRVSSRRSEFAAGPIESVEVLSADGRRHITPRTGDSVKLRIKLRGEIPAGVVVGVRITTPTGVPVFGVNTQYSGTPIRSDMHASEVDLTFESLLLSEGEYVVGVDVHDNSYGVLESKNDALRLDVLASDFYGSGSIPSGRHGLIVLPHQWDIRPLASPSVTAVMADDCEP